MSMSHRTTLVLIEPDPRVARAIGELLEERMPSFQILHASNAEEAGRMPPGLVLRGIQEVNMLIDAAHEMEMSDLKYLQESCARVEQIVCGDGNGWGGLKGFCKKMDRRLLRVEILVGIGALLVGTAAVAAVTQIMSKIIGGP